MADFSVSRQSIDPGCPVLELAGELDLAGAPTMRSAGLAALADPGCSTLVVDATALTFVDSSGIGSWVELHNHAQEQGQRLILRGLSGNLIRVLTIAGLVTLFDLDAGPPEVGQAG